LIPSLGETDGVLRECLATRTCPAIFEVNSENEYYVERFIGSVRHECLDHVIVLNASRLRAILKSYVAYYMDSRLHLALGKDSPQSGPVSPPVGRVIATPQLGGLHHRYDRRAA